MLHLRHLNRVHGGWYGILTVNPEISSQYQRFPPCHSVVHGVSETGSYIINPLVKHHTIKCMYSQSSLLILVLSHGGLYPSIA
jgi:hypothetical protein